MGRLSQIVIHLWTYFFKRILQTSSRYKHHQENFRKILANGITPYGLRIKKTMGIVPVTEDFHIKWNEILKGTERKLIELLLVESEKVISKILLGVDSSINLNYSENSKSEAKRLLDRNKYLEKTLEQPCKKKWKKFTNRVDNEYLKPRDMTQLRTTGGIIEELDQEKVTVDVESIEGVERKVTYVEVLSKVVTNTVGTKLKPKNTNKNKIMETNVSKAKCNLRGDNEIEGGENIHFAIENKMSNGKKNEFAPERELKGWG